MADWTETKDRNRASYEEIHFPRPGAVVAPFPTTATTARTQTSAFSSDGAAMFYATNPVHVVLDATADSNDMLFEGGKVHVMRVESGTKLSFFPYGGASTTVHLHLVV